MHVIRFFFLETTRIEKINNFSRIRGGISHREVPIDQLNDTITVFIPIQIQFIHAIFISRLYHRLSAEKGRDGAGNSKKKRKKTSKTRSVERKQQRADGSAGWGREGEKTTGRWKLVDRESEKGEGQHGARKIGPAKISLISLSEIAAKCNASPVDERSPSAAS